MNTQHTGEDTAKASANYCELRTQTQGIGTMNENHKNNTYVSRIQVWHELGLEEACQICYNIN